MILRIHGVGGSNARRRKLTLSAGMDYQNGLRAYFVKDIATNRAHIFTDSRVPPPASQNNELLFQKTWGKAEVVDLVVTAWIGFLSEHIGYKCKNLRVKLLLVKGTFPLHPLAYLFNLNADKVQPQMKEEDRVKIANLYSNFNSVTVELIRIKSHPLPSRMLCKRSSTTKRSNTLKKLD